MTNEDLLAISGLLDVRLNAMEGRLVTRMDTMEVRMDTMEARMDTMEAKLEAKMDAMEAKLEARIKRVELILENDILPRLQNIENCYVTTYERYRESVAGYTVMQEDLEILKKVVTGHSEKLKKMA